MSLTDREQAVLDATAEYLMTTAPVLARFLATGPELLRLRGFSPAVIDDLVPGPEPVTWRTRVRRYLQPRAPHVAPPPEQLA